MIVNRNIHYTNKELPFFKLKAPKIDSIQDDALSKNRVNLAVLRLDEIHRFIHGNKFFKLKYNLIDFLGSNFDRIVSFGGAYSNHLYALAAAGKYLGIETIGIVRGELKEPLNPVLSFARDCGMLLFACDRNEYRRKNEAKFREKLRERFGNVMILPEGGSNKRALLGCQEVVDFFDWRVSAHKKVVGVACGTGATFAGIGLGIVRRWAERNEIGSMPSLLGVSVLKAPGYIERQVTSLWKQCSDEEKEMLKLLDWRIEEDFNGGGYAKTDPQLKSFMKEFESRQSVPIEPVYTGKLMNALFSLVGERKIDAGSNILAIHTGGVYGSHVCL
ncbi:MAG: pyridoxal-phosphate dependent enzyme [Gammaproteobacteria bacterium]|nr:pyridoxal-phosphate dependent enzyme [Gammaproteobacteria bacterium]